MSWLAPAYLGAAGAAAAAVALLHLLAWRRPPALALPTARFIPDRPARAVSRAVRPSDLALLALRMAIVMLVGAAFAGPVRTPARRAVARVVAADLSRAVRDPAEVADSARRWLGAGDALVLFDSAARVSDTAALASLGGTATAGATRGSLSAALAASLGAARTLGAADTLELVLVTPVAAEELDQATPALRALWPGRVRLVRAAAMPDSASGGGGGLEVRGAPTNDPVLAAAALLGGPRAPTTAATRVVRSAPNGADSAWAGAARGRVLLVWPAAGAPGAAWTPRAPRDTMGAVAADEGGAVLEAPLERAWRAPASALAAPLRWLDGEPAAIERALGAGCVREVGVPVPVAGDLALTASFRRLLLALAGPCGGTARLAPVADAELAWLVGAPVAGRTTVESSRPRRSPYTPWLFAAALVLAGLAEPLLRRARAESGSAGADARAGAGATSGGGGRAAA